MLLGEIKMDFGNFKVVLGNKIINLTHIKTQVKVEILGVEIFAVFLTTCTLSVHTQAVQPSRFMVMKEH
jgi:hypothetical protein